MIEKIESKKVVLSTISLVAAALILSFNPSITGDFHGDDQESDRVEDVFSVLPEEKGFTQRTASSMSSSVERWVEKEGGSDGLQIWENQDTNETRIRYTEDSVGIEITSSEINWNGSAEMKAFEQFDGLREGGWVEMDNFTENYTGKVILPDTYSNVLKCEGSQQNPDCGPIEEQGQERPYYETRDGKTVVYVDSFSGVAGSDWFNTSLENRHNITYKNSSETVFGPLNSTSPIDEGFDSEEHWVYGTLRGENGEYLDVYHGLENGWNESQVANSTTEYCTFRTQPENYTSCNIQSDPLQNYWTLDETGPKAWDHIGGQHGGALSGSVTQGAEGYIGNAYSFDGNDDYVALNKSFEGTIDQFTATAWVKVPPGGGDWSILDFDRSEYFTFATRGGTIGSGGGVDFATTSETGTLNDMKGTTNISDGSWHFVAVKFNSSAVNDKKIYVDGTLDAQEDAHGEGNALGTGTTRYGFIGDGSEAGSFDGSRNNGYFRGNISEVRYYDQALSDERVEALYYMKSSLGAEEGIPVDVGTPEIGRRPALGDQAEVKVNVTTGGTVDDVLLNLTDNSGNVVLENAKMSNDTSITEQYSYSYSGPGTSEAGLWDLEVSANSTAGGTGQNSTQFYMLKTGWDNLSKEYRHRLDGGARFGSISGAKSIDEGFDSFQHRIYGMIGNGSSPTFAYHQNGSAGGWNETNVRNDTGEYCQVRTQPENNTRCPNPPNDLQAFWALDETGAQAWDHIGGNHGSLQGGVTQGENGIIGDSYSFDGGSGEVDTGLTASDFNISGSKPKTIMAWVYPRSWSSAGGGVWSTGTTGTDGRDYSMRQLGTGEGGGEGEWRAQLWGSADIDFSFGGNDQWAHLTLTYDGSNLCVYTNGTQEACNAESLDTADSDTFEIGQWDSQYIDAKIDGVRVYDSALSESRIRQVANVTSPLGREESLNEGPVSIGKPEATPDLVEETETVNITVNATDVGGEIDSVVLNLTDDDGNLEVENAEMQNDTSVIDQFFYEYTPADEQSNPGTWNIEVKDNNTLSYTDSNSSTFEVVDKDEIKPEFRRLEDDSGGSTLAVQSTEISVETLDNISGVKRAVLATNETGAFENKTGIYASPEELDGSVDIWKVADFSWSNASFDGTLGYRVWTKDVAGNWGRSGTGTFQVESGEWYNKSLKYRHEINNSENFELVGSINGSNPVNETYDSQRHWIYGTISGGNDEDLYAYHEDEFGGGWNHTVVASSTGEYCAFQTLPHYASNCANPPEGLEGFWTFDTNLSEAVEPIRGRNGTIAGPTQGVEGIRGNAYRFRAGTDTVDTGLTASDYNISGSKPKTIMAWVKPQSWNGGGVWSTGTTGTDGRDFSMRQLGNTEGEWRTQLWGSADIDFSFGGNDQWHHIALVYNNSEARVYTNGTFEASNGVTLDTADADTLNFGEWDGQNLNGSIDNARVYDRALSQAEIQNVFEADRNLLSEQEIATPPPFNSWWNSSWSYRKPHDINNTLDQTLNNFQVKIELNSTSVGPNFNWTEDRNATRVTRYNPEYDNETELNHWIEEWNAAKEEATIWVNVTEIPKSSEDEGLGGGVVRLYQYYGNKDAESTSNGSTTMDFFDDFKGTSLDSKWQINTSNYNVGNSELRINAGAVTLNDNLSFALNDGYILEGKILYEETGSWYSGTLSSQSSKYTEGGNSGGDATSLYMRGNGVNTVRRWTGTGSSTNYDCGSSDVFTSSNDVWYILGSEFDSSGVNHTRNRTLQGSFSCNWVKDLDYVSLGAFSGDSGQNIQDTTYDWTLVRKKVDQRPSIQKLDEEALSEFSVSIDKPDDFSTLIRGDSFTMNGTVSCRGDCGNVNVSGQYETQTTPTEEWVEETSKDFISFNSSVNVSTAGERLSLESKAPGAPWWNTSWNYREPFNMSNTARNLTDYQVKLELNQSNVGPNFNWSEENSTRLTWYNASSGRNVELEYWIESWDRTENNATVWTKVPYLENDTETRIYLYYGNPDVGSESNSSAVFEFFDDFEGSSLKDIWTASSPSDVTVSGGKARVNRGNIYLSESIGSTPQNRIFETKALYHTQGDQYSGLEIADSSGTEGGNSGSDAVAYIMTSNGGNDMSLWGADGTTNSYNIVSGDNIDNSVQTNSEYLLGFEFRNDSEISYFERNATTGSQIGGSTYSGTWNSDYWLWLGYFTGDNAGTENIDDTSFDWVRVRKYADPTPSYTNGSEQELDLKSSGKYVSSVFDTEESNPDYQNIFWDASIPTNTSLSVSTRSSSDNSTWGTWYTQSNDSQVFAPDERYIQYRVELSKTDTNNSPSLNRNTIQYESSSAGFVDMQPSGTTFTSNRYNCGETSNENCTVSLSPTPTELGRYFLRLKGNGSEIAKSGERDIDVYAETFITDFNTNVSTVGRGRSVRFDARLRDDLTDPLAGYSIRFNDTTEFGELDLVSTNSSGWATLEYRVPEDASLGNHQIRAAFDGSGEDYLLESNDTTTVDYSSVPLVENLTSQPNATGFGANTTLSADVEDAKGIDQVTTQVELPNGSTFEYPMSLESGKTYTRDFDQTWNRGTHSFRVIANNTDGVETVSEYEKFVVNASLDARVNTQKESYDANEKVQISTERDDWLNTSWDRRIPITLKQNGGSTRSDAALNITLDTEKLINAGRLQPDADDLRFESQKPVLEAPITIDNTGKQGRTSKPVKVTISDSDILSAVTTDNELRFFESEVEQPYEEEPLDYWVEERSDNGITVWVETDLPIDAQKQIYMYYGDDGADDKQNYQETFESKVAETGRKLQGTSWSTLNLGSGFAETPVVLASVNSDNETDPVVTRVRNITQNDFQMRIEEYPSDDGFHAQELTSYAALEKGNWIVRGEELQVGTTTTNSGTEVWKSFNYDESTGSQPVLIGQINSFNEPDIASNIRLQNVGQTGAEVKIEDETGGHTNETIGYAVGSSTSGGVFDLASTANSVTHTPYQYNYSEPFSETPALVGSFQTENGGDNGHDNIGNFSSENFTVSFEEPPSFDGPHTDEIFGLFATTKDEIYGTEKFDQPTTTAGESRQVDTISQKVPYWLGGGVGTNSTEVWVNIPTLTPDSESKIFAYYNNSDANPESNLTAVSGTEPLIGEFEAPANASWKNVSLSRPFNDPVVVATSNTEESAESPKIAQVRNVRNSTFSARLCEAESSSCDDHPSENVSYLVVEEDEFSDKEGVEASNNLTLSGGGVNDNKTVDYLEVFDSNPVIIAQAVNGSRTPPTTIQAVDVGTAEADVYACQHDGGEGCNSVGPTQVNWIAAEPGSVPYEFIEAGEATGIGNSAWTSQTFSKVSEEPGVVGTVQTNDGAQQVKPSMARSVTSSGMQIRYCEHDSADVCNDHNGEDVGWIAGEFNAQDNAEVSSSVKYDKNETKKTGIVNTGNTTVEAFLAMYVIKPDETSIVPQVINDRASDTIRTIPPGERLNISQIWRSSGAFNTSDYDPGEYRVHVELEDPDGSILQSFTGEVVDEKEFIIENVTVNLTDLEHENRFEHSVNEYEVGDTLEYVNVSVGAVNNTAINANATLNLEDASWGPDSTKQYGDIQDGEARERSWTNSSTGYPIPLDANTGTYTYDWNVTLRAENQGERRFNDSQNFSVVNNVETFDGSIDDTDNKIIRNESVNYTFNFTNRWSQPIENANVTLNCDDSELGCKEVGASDEKAELGTVSAGSTEDLVFNITTDTSTATKDYDINVTVEYENPDETRVWEGYGQETLAVRIPGALLNITDSPVDITRTEEVNFTGYVNNTFNQDLTNSEFNWYIPGTWTNTSGNLSETEAVQSSGETISVNVTLQPGLSSSLGETTLKVNTTNDENREDEETLLVDVYADTNTSVSTTNPTPDRGGDTTVEADVELDDGSVASGVEVDFYDETTGDYLGTDTTDGSGQASVLYEISDSAQLGEHELNATFNGSGADFYRGSSDNITIDIGKKPTINKVTDRPDPVGYGYNVTVTANVTDSDGISGTELLVEYPNGTESSFSMTNVNTTFYQKNFSKTDQDGRYFYSIKATDSTGSTFETSDYKFDLEVESTTGAATDKKEYEPNQDVYLNASKDWWNRSFSYRKQFKVSSSQDLYDYQEEIQVDTASLINNGYMNNSCKDIRFTWKNQSTGEERTTDFFVEEGCGTSSTDVWVKLPFVNDTRDAELNMYYGDFEAGSEEDQTGTFSYSEPQTVGYITSDNIVSSGLEVTSLCESNTVEVAGNTYNLDEAESQQITSGISENTSVDAQCAVQAEGIGGTTDTITPVNWKNRSFLHGGARGTDRYCITSPSEPATVEIYDGGTLNNTVSVGAGESQCVTTDISPGNAGNITANTSVLVSHSSGGQDSYPIYPATNSTLYGVPSSNGFVAAGPSGASVEVVRSDGGTSTSAIGASSEYNFPGSADGASDAVKVETDDKIGTIQQADSDGTESTTFLPERELNSKYGSGRPAQYVVVATPNSGTECTLEGPTTSVTQTVSGSDGIYRAGFGTGNSNRYLEGGWTLSCTAPVHAYYEGDDEEETNLLGPKQLKRTSESITVTEEPQEKQSGSFISSTFDTGFKGYLVGTVEKNSSGTWTDVETVVNDSSTDTLRTVAEYGDLNLSSIWNSDPFNVGKKSPGTYRVRLEVKDKIGRTLEGENDYLNTSEQFEIVPADVVTNVSEIRVYNVTNNPNNRIYTGDLTGSGSGTKIRLVDGEQYRAEVQVDVLSTSSSSWNIDGDINLSHFGLDPSWTVSEIWYSNSSDRSDTRFEGGSFDGTVEWDTSNNGTVDPGGTLTLYYVFDTPVSSDSLYDIDASVSDPRFLETQSDEYEVVIPENIPPYIYNGVYGLSKTDVVRNNDFKIFGRWNETIGESKTEFNSTTSTLSNETLSLPANNPRNWTNYTYSTSGLWERGSHVAKLYAKDDKGNWNGTLEHLEFDIFGLAEVTNKNQRSSFKVYDDWNYRQKVELDNTDAAQTLESFQVRFNISYKNNMTDSFRDLRFSYENATGEFKLDHWVERNRTGDWALTWVEVPEISDTQNETLYLYYNNSQASSASSAAETLEQKGLWLTQWQDGHSSNPANENEMDSLFSAVSFSGRNGWSAQPVPDCGNNASNGNCNLFGADDNYLTYLEGWVRAPESGTYEFGTDSDDASDLHINGSDRKQSIGGKNVATWYGAHGTAGDFSSHSGSVTLQQGFYRFDYRHEEVTGGDYWSAGWNTPSNGSFSVIPSDFLYYRKHADNKPSKGFGQVQKNAISLECRVEDTTVGSAIDSYQVKFYNGTDSLIGTASTNSSGWATVNYEDNSLGQETARCNITENNARFYKTGDDDETFNLDKLEEENPEYLDVTQNASQVNKSDTVKLGTLWSDNFQLDAAILETNVTGSFVNESTTGLSTDKEWANFSYSPPDSASPGSYSWRQYANDTSDNFNVTSLNTLDVFAEADMEDASLQDNVISTAENATMVCRVEEYSSGNGIGGYSVDFFNSTAKLGTNTTESDGYTQFEFNDTSTGDETITCNITEAGAPSSYYNVRDSEGNDTLTTLSPGSDTTAPKIKNDNYFLQKTPTIDRGDDSVQKIFGQWSEDIDNATVEYNWSSSLVEEKVSTPYTANWTNATLDVNSSWSLGDHYAKLYAKDQVGNENDTLDYLTYEVRGNSQVSFEGPTGEIGRSSKELTCRVTDFDNGSAISSYSVSFYDSSNFLGSSNTNGTGYATLTNDFTDYDTGNEQLSCTISSQDYYDPEVQTDSETVNIVGDLNTTILHPEETDNLTRGDFVDLNSTTVNSTNDYISPDTLSWSNGTEQIATGENTSWQVAGPVGPFNITAESSKTDYENGTDRVEVDLFGLANVSTDSPASGSSFGQGEQIELVCGVADTSDSDALANYSVEFTVENSTDSYTLGSNETNSTGSASFTWDSSGYDTGTYYPGCNIGDEPDEYYFASSDNTDNTTVDLTATNGKLTGNLTRPADGTTVAQNRTFRANATVDCTEDDCGDVTATLRYNSSSQEPDTAISDTPDKPFHVIGSNPRTCATSVSQGGSCNVSWEVNATAAKGTSKQLDAEIHGTTATTNDTENKEVAVDIVLILNSKFSNVDFPQDEPGAVVSAPQNTGQGYTTELDENSNDATGGAWIKMENLTKKTGPDTQNRIIPPENTSWSLQSTCSYAGSQPLHHEFYQILPNLDSGENFTQCFWQEVPYGKYFGGYNGTLTIKVNATN